ncbi:MAG: 2-amino-4-hydroxy-6-hydroxymethyldihydropteridine diphosphokinase [Planctomycetota bacterium]
MRMTENQRRARARRLVLGLGSNLGDRDAHLRDCRNALEAQRIARIDRVSSVWETVAVGPVQPDFLNQVLVATTELSARELLVALKALESLLGRHPTFERWGPRAIDIDIIDYDGEILRSDALTLPHPELAERRFVLGPWAELERDYSVPGLGATVGELLARLPVVPAEIPPHFSSRG